MGRKISIVLFWTLILFSVIALSRMTWQDWRGSLRTAAFVVPFVWLTLWFQSRFVGQRRRTATIMIYSGLFAIGSGSVVLWNLVLSRGGFQAPSVEAAVAGAVFVACSAVFIWSLCRLLRRVDKVPT